MWFDKSIDNCKIPQQLCDAIANHPTYRLESAGYNFLEKHAHRMKGQVRFNCYGFDDVIDLEKLQRPSVLYNAAFNCVLRLCRENRQFKAPRLTNEDPIRSLQSIMIWCLNPYQNKHTQPMSLDEKAYIKKDESNWEFGFNNDTAQVDEKLKGLTLIEFLLLHPNKEYTPLELLQETGQRGKEETEPEKIYKKTDISKIKNAIQGLKGRLELSSDTEEKKRLEGEIQEAEHELYKSRNCKGKSRKLSDRYRLSVCRKIYTVLNKIIPQSTPLYNHLKKFLNRGEICSYKPNKEIGWEIFSITSQK